MLAIVHTNQRFRTEIFESSQEKSSEEFIKYPIKVSGIYRDVTFDKSCSFSGTNVKAHGSIVSLDNETIIDMEFILNSWDCGKFPRDFTKYHNVLIVREIIFQLGVFRNFLLILGLIFTFSIVKTHYQTWPGNY